MISFPYTLFSSLRWMRIIKLKLISWPHSCICVTNLVFWEHVPMLYSSMYYYIRNTSQNYWFSKMQMKRLDVVAWFGHCNLHEHLDIIKQFSNVIVYGVWRDMWQSINLKLSKYTRTIRRLVQLIKLHKRKGNKRDDTLLLYKERLRTNSLYNLFIMCSSFFCFKFEVKIEFSLWCLYCKQCSVICRWKRKYIWSETELSFVCL